MNMGKMWKYLTLAGALLMFPAAVQAQEIIVTGELLPLHVSEAVDSEKMTIPVSNLDILGKVDDQHVLVMVDKNFLYADMDELSAQLPLFDMSSLPSSEGMTVYNVGTNGDQVKVIQQQLKDLGFLELNVDGAYGAGTGAALYNWQASEGFPTNGVADIPMQWVLAERAAGLEPIELTYPTDFSAEGIYGDLLEKVNGVDMEILAVPSWSYTSDQESGSGLITTGTALGNTEVADPAVDRIKISADLSILVKTNDAGAELLPVIETSSEGAFRPYLENAVIKAGGREVSLPVRDTAAQTGEGISIFESAFFDITGEAAALIKEADDKVVITFTGAVADYEMEISDSLEKTQQTLSVIEQAGLLK